MHFTEIIGWVGMIMVLLSYGLAAHGRWKPNTYSYLLVNTLASLGLIVNAQARSNYPNVVLNVFWILFTVSGAITLARNERRMQTLKQTSIPLYPHLVENRVVYSTSEEI